MPRPRLTAASRLHRAAAPGRRPCGARARSGFTLTELLVAAAIILGLMTLIGTAVSASRGSQKANSTRQLISRLDDIIRSRLSTYDSRSVATDEISSIVNASNFGPSAARCWFIRRRFITGDLPDRWTDIKYMAETTGQFPIDELTGPQKAYVAIWNGLPVLKRKVPGEASYDSNPAVAVTTTFAGAECLFMIVMQSGIADFTDLSAFKPGDIGDKDADGMPEFWDAWGNPIGFILWPAAVELPSGSGTRFFSGSRALIAPFEDRDRDGVLDSGEDTNGNLRLDVPTPTLGMMPLIYSAGPDGEYSFERNGEQSNLGLTVSGSSPIGRDCGNWQVAPTMNSAGLTGTDQRADNITNLDREVTR